MMKKWCLSAGIPVVLLFWVHGCSSAKTPLPQYEVQREKLKQTPPAPAATQPGAKSSGLVIDPVQIRLDEKTIGYRNLPTTVTQIFDTPPRPLSIEDVVVETLANNRQISIEGYTLRIAEFEIPVSKGIYDLIFRSRLQYGKREEQTSTAGFGSLGVNRSRTESAEFRLGQLIPTGANVELFYSLTRMTNLIPIFTFNTPTGAGTSGGGASSSMFTIAGKNDVNYQARAGISLTQPLLNGFGPTVTNANIRIAQLERQGTAADFQTQIEDQLLNALLTYWNLIEAIEFYKVQAISYSAALDLLRVDQAKFAAGVVPKTDVLQSKAAAESRRDQVIQARQAIRDTEDRLKRLIFLQASAPLWQVQIRPTQAIAWREIDVNLDQTIAEALKRRPELRRAHSNIDQTGVNVTVAKNRLLPQLNLFSQFEVNGLARGFGQAQDNMESGDYTSYAAGLEFSYPLQNRTARYRYKQAGARRQQSGEQLQDLRDQVTLEVRQAVRDLRTARDRITASQAAVISEEAKLAAERKRHDVGISTAYQVLLFQQDLTNAQVQHVRAVIDYNRAAVRLERARGAMLATYGVQVVSADLTPPAKPVTFPVGLD